jgi:hypothetical protein
MTVDKFCALTHLFEDEKNSNPHRNGYIKNWHQNLFMICNSCLWCASCLTGLENITICPSCNKSSVTHMEIASNNDHSPEEELSTLNLMREFK